MIEETVKEQNITRKDLAIIIPAYKLDFLEQTLKSISLQTNKNFNVYIGNDKSPEDIYAVCKKFENDFSLYYKEFEENLGGKSLVKQWERCIDLSIEKWIWLFSDDDLMDNNAVQVFYDTLEKTNEKYDVYRFEVSTIDDNNSTLKSNQGYRELEYPIDYIKSKFLFKYQSCVTNSIFSRKKFFEVNRFDEFDLAWGTDDTFWIKLSTPNGIYTTPDSKVYFRIGNKNISNNNSKKILYRKIAAQYEFITWVAEFLDKKEIKFKEFNKISQNWFYNVTFGYKKMLPLAKCIKMARTGSKVWGNSVLIHLIKMLLFTNRLIGKKIKYTIRKT